MKRKEAIQKMGILGLSPIIPRLLPGMPESPGIKEEFINKRTNLQLSERMLLQPLNYDEVKLQNSSLSRQIAVTKDYYLNIPNDDLLKGFRQRMHLPVYGAKDLGGWYSNDRYNIFGQILSGLSRLYPVTGDEDCKKKIDALIHGWAECIAPDGYFYYSDHPNTKHYIYEKMVGGLVDAYVFTDNKKALVYLSTITDWAIKNLDKRTPYANYDVAAKMYYNHEWYTLSENLYRAYEVTKDKKYYDFADHWEGTEYWELFANKISIFTKDTYYHAYSHLNTLSGAAMAYITKGEEHYLDTIKNAYDFFQNEECYATGGYGPNEALLSKENLIEFLRNTHASFETQCGSWAAFKLCKYLIMLTGDARYGDWIEQLIYNGAGADIPMSSDGKVLYYSDYNPRQGRKVNNPEGWTCCAGTRPENVGEYANLVYFKKKNNLYVNLFTPSRVIWNNIEISQKTNFPNSNETNLEINIPDRASHHFTINFRIPGWLTGDPALFINKRPVSGKTQNNWLQINRSWKNGDNIKLIFPMQLAINRLDKNEKYPAAITYGPVVMGIRSEKNYPAELLEKSEPFLDFIPVEGAPLNWHVKNMPEVLVKPYYTYKSQEWYILYLDPVVKNRIPEKDIQVIGNWGRYRGMNYYYSKEKDAALYTTFSGTGIRLHLKGDPGSGKFQVLIDDNEVGVVDEYRPKNAKTKNIPPMGMTTFQEEFKNLNDGKHTVSIKVLDEKNPKSGNTYVNLIAFEALKF